MPTCAVWWGVGAGVAIAVLLGVIFAIIFYTAQNNLFSGQSQLIFKGAWPPPHGTSQGQGQQWHQARAHSTLPPQPYHTFVASIVLDERLVEAVYTRNTVPTLLPLSNTQRGRVPCPPVNARA